MIIDRNSRSLPWCVYGGRKVGKYHTLPVDELKFRQVGFLEFPQRVPVSQAIVQIKSQNPTIRFLDGKILNHLVLTNVLTRTPAWHAPRDHDGCIVFAGVMVEFKFGKKILRGYPAVAYAYPGPGVYELWVVSPDEILAHPSQFAVLT